MTLAMAFGLNSGHDWLSAEDGLGRAASFDLSHLRDSGPMRYQPTAPFAGRQPVIVMHELLADNGGNISSISVAHYLQYHPIKAKMPVACTCLNHRGRPVQLFDNLEQWRRLIQCSQS